MQAVVMSAWLTGAIGGAIGSAVGGAPGAIIGAGIGAGTAPFIPAIPSSKWTCTLSGTYRVLPNRPKLAAYNAFQAIVQDRRAQVGLGKLLRDRNFAQAGLGSLVLLSQNYSEGIYDRSVSFSVTWAVYTYAADIMKATGMWRPVPGASANLWAASMAKAFSVRGYAGLESFTSDDVIVDLCESETPRMVSDGDSSITTELSGNPLFPPKPEKEASWLEYQNEFQMDQGHNRIEHQLYQDNPTVTPGNAVEMGSSRATGSVSFHDRPHQIKHVIQDLGAPSYRMVLSGGAVRVAYPIPIPEVVTIGGQTAHILERHRRMSVVSHVPSEEGPLPVYAATWADVYTIDDAPSDDLMPPHNVMAGYGKTDVIESGSSTSLVAV